MRRKFVQFIASGVSLTCVISSLTTPILAETNVSQVIEQNISEEVQEEIIKEQPQEEVQKLDTVVNQENISEEITEEIPIEENSIQEIEERVEVNEINQEDALSSNLVQDFVTRLYTNCIGRTPSQSEVSYWEGRLRNSQETGTSIANFFANSKEVQQKNLSNMAYIQMLYRAFFGREADDKGLEYWISEMIKGKSRQQALKAFIDSKEYTNICSKYGIKKGAAATTPTVSDEPPAGYTPVQKFVYRFYSKCLGRVPDQSGINYWSQGLLNKQFTGQEIAYNFVNSKEFKNKNLSNEDYINVMYKVFFGREADQGGKQYWLGMLQSWSRQKVLDSFILSDEFFGICNSYDIIVLDEHAEITGFTRGTGTYENPYMITKPDQLGLIEQNINQITKDTYFVLGADINLQGREYTPIGTKAPFKGVFDGNGHKITNLTISASNQNYVSLFAQTSDTAVLYRICLEKVNIVASTNNWHAVGALVSNNAGTILGCSVAGSVSANNYNTGGLVGYNKSSGKIYNSLFEGICKYNSTNSYDNYLGGLVGENEGLIDSCYTSAEMVKDWKAGGLVGKNYKGKILNSFSNINITTSGINGTVGGLICKDEQGKIYNCYAIGKINGSKMSNGGLIGYGVESYLENCYSAVEMCDVTSWSQNDCNGLLIGANPYGSTMLVNCYGFLNNNKAWGYGDKELMDCKIFSLDQMRTDYFTQLLNSHVGNEEWLHWTRNDQYNYGLPYFVY